MTEVLAEIPVRTRAINIVILIIVIRSHFDIRTRMDGTNDGDPDGQQRTVDDKRRNVLKLTGVGVGLAGIAGATSVGAMGGDDKDENGDDKGDDDTGKNDGSDGENGDSDHFIADLVDPTFGYPLAADETDDLSLEHVVTATIEEGPGAHPNFPTEEFGGEGMDGPPSGTETPNGTTSTPTGTETGTDTNGTPGGSGEIPAEFFFDPVGLHVEPDDLVHFANALGTHTITAFHEKFSEPEFEMPTRVPEGVPGFTSPPIVQDESWVYQFVEPGVYDYLCFPHLGLGMVGRIVVFDPEKHNLDDEAFAEPETGGLLPNVERVLTAPELDPAHIVENCTVAWADLTLDGAGTDTDNGMATTTTDE